MGVLSAVQRIYRRQPEPDYETILSSLDTKVKARENHLLAIKLRERRANALFITYGLGLWALYSILWYALLLHRRHGLQGLLVALPVFIGPVFIIFTRRILRWYYHRQQVREETGLRQLKKEQHEKIEELKRKTGYYSTRDLLEKYDDAVKKNTEVRATKQAQQSPGKGSNMKSQTPTKKPSNGAGQSAQTVGAPPMTPQQQRAGVPLAPGQLPLLPPAPSTPQPRTLMDKVADALLGVTPEEMTPPQFSKYALICGKCFAHNGLVPKDEFDTIQYQCPRCGYFNPRRKEVQDAAGSAGGHRRRVQSMHVAGSGRSGLRDELEVEEASPTREAPSDLGEVNKREDESTSPSEALLLPESSNSTKPDGMRRRTGKAAGASDGGESESKAELKDDDEMDTDP